MTLTLRGQKSAPLTIEEMDNNFLYLKELINKKMPKIGIKQNGHRVTFVNEEGETLGSIMIPIVTPIYQGKWEKGKTYHVGHWVRKGQGIYGCVESHTSEDFEKDQSFWQLVIGDLS